MQYAGAVIRRDGRPCNARALGGLVALALAGCGGLPKPVMTAAPVSAFEEVPYPPPPARAEVVPQKPRSGDVWVDGEWDWDGKKWRWEPGGWVAPPPNATFQPWMTSWRRDGRLFYARATWRDASGRAIDGPTPDARARVRSLTQTAEASPK
jgi:hypothetical protein